MQHERLFLMDNITEDFDYLVITNKFLDNRLYHYIVHLGRLLFLTIVINFFSLFYSSLQCFSKYITIINVIVFQC